MGYLDEPEETHRVFNRGWLRTGDLGHLDSDGYIWIDGRKSAFLKMRGVRVSFGEVERRVAAVPGVYECAATAVPHPEAGEALALYIVPDKGTGDVTRSGSPQPASALDGRIDKNRCGNTQDSTRQDLANFCFSGWKWNHWMTLERGSTGCWPYRLIPCPLKSIKRRSWDC